MSVQRLVVDPNGRPTSADSFQRFDNQLTQALIDFLSFEDKIRYLCVAKLWNSLLLSGQKWLDINDHMHSDINGVRQLLVDKKIENVTKKAVIVSRLKTVLKMCPNLVSIDMSDVYVEDSILSAITDNCPHLCSIGLNLSFTSKEEITRFGRRFGSKMKSIELNEFSESQLRVFDHEDKHKLLISFCPFVRCLSAEDILVLSIEPLLTLERLEIQVLDEEVDENFFSKVATTAPNLKKLMILEPIDEIDISLDSLPKPLSNLDDLEVCGFHLDDSFMANISRLTPNLKRLSIEFSQMESISDKTLQYLSELKSLTKISIDSDITENSVTDWGLCYLIDNCHKLREIELQFVTNITTKTIARFAEKAKNRPKERFTLMTIGDSTELMADSDWNHIKNLIVVLSEPFDVESDQSDSEDSDYEVSDSSDY